MRLAGIVGLRFAPSRPKESDMKTGQHTNEYGVRVTEHICKTCGVEFTVCPGIDNWNDCLVEPCQSYDPERDIDNDLGNLASGPRLVIH